MLDITQLNRSLLMRDATDGSRRGSPAACVSMADSALRLSLASARPTVTWRMTCCCNLNCLNCLSDAQPRRSGSELTTEEGKALIRDLAGFSVSSLVFAGGEPLLRADLPELVGYTSELGVRPSLLTNGTLLTLGNAARLRSAGLRSASILLEGMGREVDHQRGMRGAFQATLDGYASCQAAGIPAEVRMPLTRWNAPRLAAILDAMERWQVRKVVFAHMVYAGRGNHPQDDMTAAERRRAIDIILERADDLLRREIKIQIATDENHTDGVYLYLRLARRDPWRAAMALRLLQTCGANFQGAGIGTAGIDFVGGVHPDPYWSNHVLGNVRQMPFSEIWQNTSDVLLQGLRDRLPLLQGRCGNCRWKETCGGNLRVRAAQFYGDPWTSDPACYLTNQEIGKEGTEQVEAMEDDVLLPEQAA